MLLSIPLLLLSCYIVSSTSISPPSPFNDNCIIGQYSVYNASKAKQVPWYTIDLDQPASTRWQKVATIYKQEIKDAIGVLKHMTKPLFHGKLIAAIDKVMGQWITLFPADHRDEIQSFATHADMPVGEMVLFNVFYEIAAACTSIVASDPNGNVIHARNMDFGTFFGWNTTTHTWLLTEALRKLLINVEWKQNGTVTFKSVGFAGFTGIFNGVRSNAFSISMDTRHELVGGYFGLIKWVLGLGANSQFSSWNVRDALEKATTYEDAFTMLRDKPLLAPCYYIVGSPDANEGGVIARDMNKAKVFLKNETEHPWYILETNYDLDKKPFFLDERRKPGNICMQKLGKANVAKEGLMNVISSKTTLNKATVFSTLMVVATGDLESYVQRCQDPCFPF